jgi:hypothetical protein
MSVYNPLTNRWIMQGGAVHRKLMREGILDPYENKQYGGGRLEDLIAKYGLQRLHQLYTYPYAKWPESIKQKYLELLSHSSAAWRTLAIEDGFNRDANPRWPDFIGDHIKKHGYDDFGLLALNQHFYEEGLNEQSHFEEMFDEIIELLNKAV